MCWLSYFYALVFVMSGLKSKLIHGRGLRTAVSFIQLVTATDTTTDVSCSVVSMALNTTLTVMPWYSAT